jgi:hypothetical protein
MITQKPKPISRREAVRKQFRDHAMRLNPSLYVTVKDSFGRPRKRVLPQKA